MLVAAVPIVEMFAAAAVVAAVEVLHIEGRERRPHLQEDQEGAVHTGDLQDKHLVEAHSIPQDQDPHQGQDIQMHVVALRGDTPVARKDTRQDLQDSRLELLLVRVRVLGIHHMLPVVEGQGGNDAHELDLEHLAEGDRRKGYVLQTHYQGRRCYQVQAECVGFLAPVHRRPRSSWGQGGAQMGLLKLQLPDYLLGHQMAVVPFLAGVEERV